MLLCTSRSTRHLHSSYGGRADRHCCRKLPKPFPAEPQHTTCFACSPNTSHSSGSCLTQSHRAAMCPCPSLGARLGGASSLITHQHHLHHQASSSLGRLPARLPPGGALNVLETEGTSWFDIRPQGKVVFVSLKLAPFLRQYGEQSPARVEPEPRVVRVCTHIACTLQHPSH